MINTNGQQEPEEQKRLHQMEMLLDNLENYKAELGSVEAFCGLLKQTVPQANDTFRQQLEAQLLAHTQAQSEKRQHQGLRIPFAVPDEPQPGKGTMPRYFQPLYAFLSFRGWIPVASLAAVLLMVITFFTVPPLQTLAQELIGLLTKTATDTIRPEELGLGQSTEPVIVDPLVSAKAEVEKAAGFDVWVPPRYLLFPGYRLELFVYEPSQHFVSSTYSIAPTLRTLNQRIDFSLGQQLTKYAKSNTFFQVGASANIEIVQLETGEGEYVEGAWCGPGSGSPVNWCPELDSRMLIWQQDDFVFALQVYGDPDNPNSLSRQEMIALASHLTPDYQSEWLSAEDATSTSEE